jgi:hypothetical protein
MPDLITSIGSTLGSFFSGAGGKALQGISTGVGGIGNILNMIQSGQQYSKLKQFENMTPQQLSARVAAGTAPLNAGLTQTVTNSVQGADAERGLATSPGIFNADLAQSLAPYQQQNQNSALQILMAQMGLPTAAKSILNPVTPLSNSFANLFKTAGPNNNPGTVPSDPNALLNLIYGSGTSDPTSGLTDTPVGQPTGTNS